MRTRLSTAEAEGILLRTTRLPARTSHRRRAVEFVVPLIAASALGTLMTLLARRA